MLLLIVDSGRKEQSSWLARACLFSICLACVHTLTALDICVSDAIHTKACGSTSGAVFPLQHFGNRVLHHGGIR